MLLDFNFQNNLRMHKLLFQPKVFRTDEEYQK